MIGQTSITRLAAIASLTAMSVAPALAQQTTVSALAADGYEVKATTTFDVNPGDERSDESLFLIMQKGTSIYGCAVQSANRSFCQPIE